jgi:hypothetical protein
MNRIETPNHITMKTSSILALVVAFTLQAFAETPAAGTAKGTCADKAEPAIKLAFAAAFTDVEDERKPAVIILSDVKLPSEKWTNDFDLMRCDVKFSGAVFFLDKDREVYRNDFYWKGVQCGVAGHYTLTLDAGKGKDFSGTITSNPGDAKDPKVDAIFHVILK